MKKLLAIVLLVLALTVGLVSCQLSYTSSVAQLLEYMGLAQMPDEEDEKYSVSLTLPEGASVAGDNPVKVKPGESVRFKIEYKKGYMFDSISEGHYDIASQTVIFNAVYSDIDATMTLNKYDFDTSSTYRLVIRGTGHETSNVPNATMVNAGIVVDIHANDMTRRFIGWSYDKPYSEGGRIFSTDRDYSFVMRRHLAGELGAVIIYPNYTDNNAVYYNPNGGTVNLASANYTNTTYYQASMQSLNSKRVLCLKIFDSYLSKVESISTLYDDGTFYRPGYVLVEYNTKADGSGEAYSLGSKVYFSPDENTPTLYCIWKEQTPEDTFVYSDYYMKNPATKSYYAPDWNKNGVIINKYTGNAETIVIPETIAGKPVIAIAADAIVGKDVKTIILNRKIQKVENGAIKNCPNLSTIYFSDSIYEMYNEALDSASYTSLTRVIVNASFAPRFSNGDGAHAIRLSRLLAGRDEKCIIMIGGSSIYEGMATEYIEALLDGEYRFVNFGTTRTTHCTMYLEAMSALADEDDIIVYAPENSSYLWGERELYWKTMRDLEGMVNIYRYIDISQYTNFFSAFTEFNQTKRYNRAGVRYEDIVKYTSMDENGDHTKAERQGYVNDAIYNPDVYYHSLNSRIKSRLDVNVGNDAEQNKEDYNNPNNEYWCSIDDPYYLDPMNRIINAAKSSGAKVYFGFCPVEANGVVEAGRNREWLRAYDALIADLYDYDGIVGRSENYIYNRMYFFDNAFHLNDYGRTYRTYQFYVDLCELIGKEAKYGIYDLGRDFDGCLFENRSNGKPIIGVDYLSEE